MAAEVNSRKISADEWGRFCGRYSREHHGWLVSVAITDPDLADSLNPDPKQWLAQNLPLQEIRENHDGNGAEVMITVGEGANETSFLVENVAAIYEATESDKDLGVRIDSNELTSTLVRFRAPASPGELDGLAASEW